MASSTDSLQTKLHKLFIQHNDVPECYSSLNPVDGYRIYLANTLPDVTGVDTTTTYPTLQRTATLDKGDLLLPVLALKIKGEKPDVLASRWADAFPQSHLVSKPVAEGPFIRFFFETAVLVKQVIPAVLQNRSG